MYEHGTTAQNLKSMTFEGILNRFKKTGDFPHSRRQPYSFFQNRLVNILLCYGFKKPFSAYSGFGYGYLFPVLLSFTRMGKNQY